MIKRILSLNSSLNEKKTYLVEEENNDQRIRHIYLTSVLFFILYN